MNSRGWEVSTIGTTDGRLEHFNRFSQPSATIQWLPSVGRLLFHRQPSLFAFQTASQQITQTDFVLRRDGAEAVGQDVFQN